MRPHRLAFLFRSGVPPIPTRAILHRSSVFQNDFSQCKIAAMRDAQADVSRAHAFCVFARCAVENNSWAAAGLPSHFNIPPANSFAPPGPESFHRCFLGGKARRVALHGIAMPLAICDLGRSKDAFQENSAVPLDRVAQSSNLLHVHPQADNHVADASSLRPAVTNTLPAAVDYTAPLCVLCGLHRLALETGTPGIVVRSNKRNLVQWRRP